MNIHIYCSADLDVATNPFALMIDMLRLVCRLGRMDEVKEPFGAVFDESGRYRYRLWRRWDPSLLRLCFVMLNPSTADATNNDPTITRCQNMAASWGYGGMEVVNLFAFRSTKPRDLWQADDPVGAHNDEHIRRAVAHCDACLIAWGNLPPTRIERTKAVKKLLSGKKVFCMGLTKMQQPRHPLYMATLDLKLEEFVIEALSSQLASDV